MYNFKFQLSALLLLGFILLGFKADNSMPMLWLRLESWMAVNTPNFTTSLFPPASEKEIQALEQHLSIELPLQYRNFLKVHNGQRYKNNGIIDSEIILNTREVLANWQVWSQLLNEDAGIKTYFSEPAKGIKNDWFNKKWIPITSNGFGDHICIDLDPDSTGTIGQIIRTYHDDGRYELLAHSFEAFLSKYIADLERGRYAYDKQTNAIVDTAYLD